MGFIFVIYLYESIIINYDYKLFYCNKELFIQMLPVCRDKGEHLATDLVVVSSSLATDI